MATESDNVNTGALATIVIVGALAMIGITTALTALVRTQQDDKREQMSSIANLKEYRELVASQRKELEEPPSWDDKSEGIVRIPVERAETLIASEYTKNPYAASPVPPDAGTDAAEAGATEAADAGAPTAEDGGAANDEAADAGAPEAPKGAAPTGNNEKGAGAPAPRAPSPPTGGAAPGGQAPAPPAPAPAPEAPTSPDAP